MEVMTVFDDAVVFHKDRPALISGMYDMEVEVRPIDTFLVVHGTDGWMTVLQDRHGSQYGTAAGMGNPLDAMKWVFRELSRAKNH